MSKKRVGRAEAADVGRDIGEAHDFRLLVESIADHAIFMLDPAGIIQIANRGLEALLGCPRADLVGRHFSRFYTEEERQQGGPEHALLTALRDGRYEREGWFVRRDGSRFWASVDRKSTRLN